MRGERAVRRAKWGLQARMRSRLPPPHRRSFSSRPPSSPSPSLLRSPAQRTKTKTTSGEREVGPASCGMGVLLAAALAEELSCPPAPSSSPSRPLPPLAQAGAQTKTTNGERVAGCVSHSPRSSHALPSLPHCRCTHLLLRCRLEPRRRRRAASEWRDARPACRRPRRGALHPSRPFPIAVVPPSSLGTSWRRRRRQRKATAKRGMRCPAPTLPHHCCVSSSSGVGWRRRRR